MYLAGRVEFTLNFELEWCQFPSDSYSCNGARVGSSALCCYLWASQGHWLEYSVPYGDVWSGAEREVHGRKVKETDIMSIGTSAFECCIYFLQQRYKIYGSSPFTNRKKKSKNDERDRVTCSWFNYSVLELNSNLIFMNQRIFLFHHHQRVLRLFELLEPEHEERLEP